MSFNERLCHWDRHEKLHPQAPHKSWSEVTERPPKLKSSFWFEVVLAAPGASDQDVWGAYGCNFSWRFQWHHRRPCPASAAGDLPIFPNLQKEQFIAGENLSPVSSTPQINIHSRIYPRIFQKNRNGPNGILRGPGKTDSKILKLKISYQTPFKDYLWARV